MGLIRPRYHAAAAVLILVACVGVQGLLAPRSASAAASLRAARVPSVAGGPLNRHRLQLNRDGHRPPQCAGSMCHAAGAHHSCFVLGAAALPAIPSWLTTLLSYLLPTKFELEMLCRLILAAALGTLIGWERRNSHRPAGVRTMSLVATGAAIFSIVSSYGFSRGDPSRVAANICSGVGFLGAGVITSDASKRSDRRGGDTVKQDYESEVRGLTTAASIWITAGLGMAAGTGLYFAAISGSAVTVESSPCYYFS
jgi:putative Mg2+ transporter-C (MgtC) family protein